MSKQATYDLFISYADADANWVDGLLLPALGLPEKRIITKESFRYGVDAVAEFERAVSESRYTLLILSPAFLADMWGMYSESIASYARVKDERDRLLPLLLKPCQISPRIEKLKLSFNCSNPALQNEEFARLRELLNQPEPILKPILCPYLGMRPFTEADSQYFFGRDRDIKELIEHLRSYPFVTVIGPSGSGKSSLVFAGVIPALRRGELFETREWLVCDIRPGENPLNELKKTLGNELTNPKMAVERALTQHPDAQRLLLVVDQLEEVFALSVQDSIPFQEVLQRLIEVPNCCVILTVRADFYPDVMTSPLWNKIRYHRKEVVPLDKEGLRDAILKPAEQVGVFVETALVERLVADAADEPGVLPLVQETLALLWGGLKRRFLPLTAYEDLSHSGDAQLTGLQVAIARHADTVLTELRGEQQTIARRIFLRLIQFGEGRPDTRRQQTVRVLRSADETQKEFDHTLEHLTTHRLLTRSGTEEDEETKVDIAHDALIDGWPTLQNWVKEWRKAEQIRRQLEVKVSDWERLNREGGLLDEVELREAEEWLNSPDAVILRYSRKLPELIKISRQAIENELEKAQATARRLRKRLIFATVFAIVAVLAAIGAYYAFRQATLNEELANQQKEVAQQERDRANQERDNAHIQTIKTLNQTSKSLLLSQNDDLGALLQGMKAVSYLNRPGIPVELKNQTLSDLREVLYEIHEKNRLEAHEATVTALDFSPDGQRLVSGSWDNTIRVWNVADGQEIMTLMGDSYAVFSVDFSPDGELFASGGGHSVKLWNGATGEEITTFLGDSDGVYSVRFSPDGKLLASGGKDGIINLWNVETGKKVMTLTGHKESVNSVAFSPDGRLLASGGGGHNVPGRGENIIKLWNVETGQEITTLKGHSWNVESIQFNPDNVTLASGSSDGTIKLWDIRGNSLIISLNGETFTFSPDGKILVFRSPDRTIKFWDIEERKELRTFQEPSNISQIYFSPNGKMLTFISGDKIILWNIKNLNDFNTYPHDKVVESVAFSPDGNILATAEGSFRDSTSTFEDGRIVLWDLKNASQMVSLSGHSWGIMSLDFSPDGKLLASSGFDKSIRLWDIENKQEIITLRGHADQINSINFSPDGKLLVSGGADNIVKLWDVATRSEIRRFKGHAEAVNSVAFHPDGTLLASGSNDKTIKLWDVKNGKEILTLHGHALGITEVRFSPDGKIVASGSMDGRIILWNVADGSKIKEFAGEVNSSNCIAFSPDGKFLASAGINIKLWQLENGREITTFTGHGNTISGIAFSPDGRILASGSADETVKLWSLEPSDVFLQGCEWLSGYLKNNPNVSDEERSLCDYPEFTKSKLSSHIKDRPYEEHIDTSIAIYQKQIEMNPNHEQAWGELGLILQEQGELHEALIAFEKQIEVNPEHGDAWYRIGELLERQGQINEATIAYRKQLEVRPEHKEALNGLKRTLQEQGLLEKTLVDYQKQAQELQAQADLNKANAMKATNEQERLSEELKVQDHLQQAATIYQIIIALQPDHETAWYNLGIILYEQEALKVGRLRSSYDKEKLQEILVAFQNQAKITPEHKDLWYRIGDVLAKQNIRDENALAALRRQVELTPDHGTAWARIGDIMRFQKKWDEALAAFQKQVEVHPNNNYAWHNIKVILENQGKIDELIALYQKQLVVTPDSHYHLFQMVEVLERNNRVDEAIAILQKEVKTHPDNDRAWDHLRTIFQNLGKSDMVFDIYQEQLAARPKHKWAWQALGRTLEKQGRLDEAILAYQKHIEVNPDNGDTWNTLGLIFWHQDKLKESAAAFAEALQLDPHNLVLLHNAAKLALIQGDIQRCQTYIMKALPLVTPEDRDFSVTLLFFLWLANPKEGWENIISAIEKTYGEVTFRGNFDILSPAIERQDKNTQQVARLFIMYFEEQIDFLTLKIRLAQYNNNQ